MQQANLVAGKLAVTVSTENIHGWCGLSSIEHDEYREKWLLAPAFTLEHYIGIPLDSDEYIEYEPCYSEKHLEALTSDRAILRYEPSPCSKIDFTADYQLVAPHYIDVTLRMKTARVDWPQNHVALFFATIVNAPIYTGINLLGKDILAEAKSKNEWIYFNSLAIQLGKTTHPTDYEWPELSRAPNAPPTYYFSDSSIRFEKPLFYALIESMVFAVMFQPQDKEHVRFTVNPLAPAFGGPAWDFFWIIPEPQVEETYTLSFRAIFKPFISSQEILEEYNAFLAG